MKRLCGVLSCIALFVGCGQLIPPPPDERGEPLPALYQPVRECPHCGFREYDHDGECGLCEDTGKVFTHPKFHPKQPAGKPRPASDQGWTIEPTYGGSWIVRDASGKEIAGDMSEYHATCKANELSDAWGIPKQNLTRIHFDWE